MCDTAAQGKEMFPGSQEWAVCVCEGVQAKTS